MIATFSIHNFRSIADMTLELSFSEARAPSGYRTSPEWVFCEPKARHRIVPCLALYGANASGKTTILKALATFRKMAVGHWEKAPCQNRLAAGDRTTRFSLEFITGNTVYCYTLACDDQGLTREELSANASLLYSVREGRLVWDGQGHGSWKKQLQEICAVECMDAGRQYCTLLSRLARNCPGLNRHVRTACDYLQGLEIHPANTFSSGAVLDQLARTRDGEHVLDETVRVLRKLDIDIVRMRPAPVHDAPGRSGVPSTGMGEDADQGVHDTRCPGPLDTLCTVHRDALGRDVCLRFSEESEGTKVLAGLTATCLSVLKKGGVLVVDELDKSLHPFVLIEIVRLFKDREYNKRNAQLLFTTNCTDLLDADLLRVSEIGIVGKTLRKGSTIRRISDYSGMRTGMDFRRHYLHGAFHGVPNPYI